MPTTDPSAPPSRELLFLEIRAFWEMSAFFTTYPLLRLAPRGDGHPVLVLPGLAASDTSTRPLRRYLKDQGYAAHGWKLGANHGPRPGAEAKMQERLAELHARHGKKVSLIGWSLGGVFAREMARRAPGHVRSVITLGSPFAGAPKASNAWKLYERASQRSVEDWPDRERIRRRLPSRAARSSAAATASSHGRAVSSAKGRRARTSRSRAAIAASATTRPCSM